MTQPGLWVGRPLCSRPARTSLGPRASSSLPSPAPFRSRSRKPQAQHALLCAHLPLSVPACVGSTRVFVTCRAFVAQKPVLQGSLWVYQTLQDGDSHAWGSGPGPPRTRPGAFVQLRQATARGPTAPDLPGPSRLTAGTLVKGVTLPPGHHRRLLVAVPWKRRLWGWGSQVLTGDQGNGAQFCLSPFNCVTVILR